MGWKTPRGSPSQEELLLKKAEAQTGASAQGAKLNVPQKAMVLNVPKRTKNWKMEPVPALLNSLYGTFGKRTVFGNLWGDGPPRDSPSQQDLRLKKAEAQTRASAQGATQCATKSNGTKRPQTAQKLENGAGPGAAKFFVWDLWKTDSFWQFVGGGGTPRTGPTQEEMLLKKAEAQTGASAQGAKLNVPQKAMVLNVPKRAKNWKMEPVPALLNSLYAS